MEWIRTHPFAVLFALAGLGFLAIVTAVGDRTFAPVAGGPLTTLSAGNIPQSGNFYTSPNATASNSQNVAINAQTPDQTQPPTNYLPPDQSPQTTPQAPDPQPEPLPSPPASANVGVSATPSDTILNDIYSLIPATTVPSPTLQAAPARTASQQALYIYGNEAGLAILTFDNANQNMAQNLKDWVDNRSNTALQAPVNGVADSMVATGNQILALSNVPASASAANTRLGQSLVTAGEELRAVVEASGSDSALADAMKTYDASADEFTKSYVALADLFTLEGITFSSSDTGSAFSFSGSQ